MPPKEIDINFFVVLNQSERQLVEEFTEGDDLIFESKFENSYVDKPPEYFTDPENFRYDLNISCGSHPLSCSLSGPEIDFEDNDIIVRWTWNTTGVRPGAYDAEAVITGPEEIHICPTEKHLAKAKKITRP